jgi:uncharacterized protein (DUF2141 family)
MPPRMRSILGTSVSIALVIALVAAGQVTAAPRPGAITVDMVGFRSDRGQALVALYGSAKGFPDLVKHAVRRVEVKIRKGTARAVLRGLPPGTYAVAVLHDEDGDREMKTDFLGRPEEGYGASRDARGKLGPPKFADARLTLGPGQSLTARIRMVYH